MQVVLLCINLMRRRSFPVSFIGSDGSLKKMFFLVVAGRDPGTRQPMPARLFSTFFFLFRVRRSAHLLVKTPNPQPPPVTVTVDAVVGPLSTACGCQSSRFSSFARWRQWLGGIRGAMQLLVDRPCPCLRTLSSTGALIGMTQRVGRPSFCAFPSRA